MSELINLNQKIEKINQLNNKINEAEKVIKALDPFQNPELEDCSRSMREDLLAKTKLCIKFPDFDEEGDQFINQIDVPVELKHEYRTWITKEVNEHITALVEELKKLIF